MEDTVEQLAMGSEEVWEKWRWIECWKERQRCYLSISWDQLQRLESYTSMFGAG
jgi:hypothetical protein